MSQADPIHIEIFTDYVCPWCYLASAAVEKIQENYPVEISWIPFPLHPSTPEDGLLMSDLFKGADIDGMHQRLYALMDDVGLEYGQRDKTYNSRLAQELAMWAQTQEGGQAIHKALYRAYFVDNKNLAKPTVLIEIIRAMGLNVEAAQQVLDKRSYKEQVDEAWSRARSMQVSGVPCFVSKQYMASGYQPYDELEKFVQYLQNN